MPNISNINYVRYLRSINCHAEGTVTGYATKLAATNAAKNAANSSSPTNHSGYSYSNSTDYSVLRLGGFYGSTSGYARLPYQESTGDWSCEWLANRNYYQSQILITFSLPSGITAANLSTAVLTINTSSDTNLTASEPCYVCAPASGYSAPTSYTIHNSSSIGSSTTFNGVATKGYTYNINIKNQLGQCLSVDQGWLLVTLASNRQDYGWTDITGVSISYTLAYSKCSAPTSVSIDNNITIQKPSGEVSILWSGAQDGTNNPITGYTIYWRTGEVPTTSIYTGMATSSTSSYSFTIPNNAIRNSIYYFKVVANGTVSGYDSDISNVSTNVVVNSLPYAPIVQVDKTRVKSTGNTTITFTVTAGADENTSQTKTLYYATSSTGTKTLFTSPLSQTLSAATTYYFWTYDGLEYSSDYATQSFTVNTAPSITGITMSPYNSTTYLPVTRDGYVTNINGSAVVTKDAAATLTYQWYLCVGNTASATSYGTETLINNSNSLNNIDVTQYGANFDKAYKLKLIITDDIGETAEGYSSNVYAIPAASISTNIYNNNSNADVGNSSNFGRYVRVKYSQNTGIIKQLLYSLNSDFSSGVTTINLTGDTYQDIDLNLLTRGSTYYFKVICTCNTLSSTLKTRTMTRVTNIIPNITNIAPISGTYVKPYTHSQFTCVFNNQPISWTNANNVSNNYGDIYTIKIKNGNQSLTLTSTGTNSSGTVTSTITLNNKTVENWITLINGGGSSAPMGTQNVILEVTATNIFGESFSNTTNFTVDFRESLIITSSNSIILGIKNSTSTYTTIPTATYTSSNRYPLFNTQTIQFTIGSSVLESYVNQPAVLKFTDGVNIVTTSITSADWSRKSGDNFKYYLNTNKILQYTIPFISADNTNLTFVIELSYENTDYSSYSVNTGSTFNYCKYIKINTSEVTFNITGITEDNGNIIINYIYGTNGGGSNAYSTQTATFMYATSPNADSTEYTDFKTINISVSSSAVSTSGASVATLEDILYFGAEIEFTAAFQNIGNAHPAGTSSYSVTFLNLNALYRTVPNLIYGKNFFGINTNSPGNNTDGILYIHQTNSRSKIYFGDQDQANFEITNDGLTLNGVTITVLNINGGTWDS